MYLSNYNYTDKGTTDKDTNFKNINGILNRYREYNSIYLGYNEQK